MKKTAFLLLAIAGFVMAGCQKDEQNTKAAFEETLGKMYNSASQFKWVTVNVDDVTYDVADFVYSSGSRNVYEATAWFDSKEKTWCMTETVIPYDELPNDIRDAFGKSEYQQWTLCGVQKLERNRLENKFRINVEKGDLKAGLFYARNGHLLQTMTGNHHDNSGSLPCPSHEDVFERILAFINGNYPGALVTDTDIEHHCIEVEIVHEHMSKELTFDMQGDWLHTHYDVAISNVPQTILDAFNASEYAQYEIDDIEFYQTADNNDFYRFELENNDIDITIHIDLNGNITIVEGNGQGGQGGQGGHPGDPNPAILAFIETHYPGAVITEIEKENHLIKVEIRHEGIEKEVYFNCDPISWIKTKWDVEWNSVPQIVRDALAQSEYAQYEIDDVEFHQTANNGEFYRLELENNDIDITIHIDLNGNITIVEGNGQGGQGGQGGNPGDPNPAILAFIETHYPGAVITEIEKENHLIKVEIRHEGIEKEVYFNCDPISWIKTKWDVEWNSVPQIVRDALTQSEYNDYEIDDITFESVTDMEYFVFEMEKDGFPDVILRITHEGIIL